MTKDNSGEKLRAELKKLAAWRRQLGILQSRVAPEMGLSQQVSISQIEHGYRPVSTVLVERYRQALRSAALHYSQELADAATALNGGDGRGEAA